MAQYGAYLRIHYCVVDRGRWCCQLHWAGAAVICKRMTPSSDSKIPRFNVVVVLARPLIERKIFYYYNIYKLLEISYMLSDIAENIKKEIEKIRTEEVGDFLKKYPCKPQRDFIQKYAETEIAIRSLKITKYAYIFALIAFLVAISLSSALIFSSTVAIIVIIIFIVLLIIIANYLIYRKEPLQHIIIAIEDADKLTVNDRVESIILQKLNEIISEVESISTRIDVLEKTINKKNDIIINEITNLEMNEK